MATGRKILPKRNFLVLEFLLGLRLARSRPVRRTPGVVAYERKFAARLLFRYFRLVGLLLMLAAATSAGIESRGLVVVFLGTACALGVALLLLNVDARMDRVISRLRMVKNRSELLRSTHAGAKSVLRLPGSTLFSWIRYVVTPRTFERVFAQLQADAMEEVVDAIAGGANRWQMFLVGMRVRRDVLYSLALVLMRPRLLSKVCEWFLAWSGLK